MYGHCRRTVIIVGGVGLGKTHLATVLGIAAVNGQ